MLAASTTEDARFTLEFVALCARLIVTNPSVSMERLGGSARFGLNPYMRWLIILEMMLRLLEVEAAVVKIFDERL